MGIGRPLHFPLTPRPDGEPPYVSPATDLCGYCHSSKGTLGLSVLDCRGIMFHVVRASKEFGRRRWCLKEQEIHTDACSVASLACCCAARGWLAGWPHFSTGCPLLVACDDTLPLSPNASQPWGLFGLVSSASTKVHFLMPSRIWAGCG